MESTPPGLARPGGGSEPPGLFPPTRWTLVTEAGSGARHALEWLCRQYWDPIRTYLRRYRLPHEDTEDLTQSFLLHLLSNGRLARPDRARGSFRSFLLTALRHYALDHLRRSARDRTVPLEEHAADAAVAPGLSPDQEYDRQFVLALLRHALEQVQADYERRGQTRRFEVLSAFLPGRDPTCSQADAARLLGLSEGAVGKALLDLRHRFREVYRHLVAQTVGSPTDVDAEISAHLDILQRPTLAP